MFGTVGHRSGMGFLSPDGLGRSSAELGRPDLAGRPSSGRPAIHGFASEILRKSLAGLEKPIKFLDFHEKTRKSTGPAPVPHKKGPFSQNVSKVEQVFVFELFAIRARKVEAGEKKWCHWKDMQLYQLKETKTEHFRKLEAPNDVRKCRASGKRRQNLRKVCGKVGSRHREPNGLMVIPLTRAKREPCNGGFTPPHSNIS